MPVQKEKALEPGSQVARNSSRVPIHSEAPSRTTSQECQWTQHTDLLELSAVLAPGIEEWWTDLKRAHFEKAWSNRLEESPTAMSGVARTACEAVVTWVSLLPSQQMKVD